jgi:hypothetical protein
MSKIIPGRATKNKEEATVESISWKEFAEQQCTHCGGVHLRSCPRVKRMIFDKNQLVEVEFFENGQWDETNVLWPEDDRVVKEEINE